MRMYRELLCVEGVLNYEIGSRRRFFNPYWTTTFLMYLSFLSSMRAYRHVISQADFRSNDIGIWVVDLLHVCGIARCVRLPPCESALTRPTTS